MNILIALGAALAVSLAGNLWLFNSRDDALTKVGTMETELRNSRALEKQCSDSVDQLERDAEVAAKASREAVAAARNASKGRVAKGQQTLAKAPSVPANECASVEVLFDEWFANRAAK